MAWTVTAGNWSSGADSSAETSAPAGVAAGNLLVLLVSTRGGGITIPSAPTGWIHQVSQTNAGGTTVHLLTRVADGTATDTPTVTLSATPTDGWQTVILKITGQDSPFLDDSGGGTDNVNDATINTPAVAVAEGASLVIAAISAEATTSLPISWPAEYTSRGENAASNHSSGIATREANTGTLAAQTITLAAAASQKTVGILVINPAAASSIVYPQLERFIRGLNRGLAA